MRGPRTLLAGYATVALLTVLPTIAVRLLDDGSALRGNSAPFAVFALAIAIMLCAIRPLQLVWQRHPAPLRQLGQDLVAHKVWFLSVALLLLAIPQTLDVAMHVKRLIPTLHPYYADTALIQVDRALFFGHDAWQVTHAVIGPAGTRMLDATYGLWHAVQISLCMLIVLTPNSRFQLQAALSFQLVWLGLGACLAVSLASVGPCFVHDIFGSNHFDPLMGRLEAIPDLHSTRTMRYLLAARGTNDFAAGISAMPSLHVAIATLAALCIRDRWPHWQWLAWAFAMTIWIASVHLGWHYATDGMVAAAGTVFIWWVVSRFLEWLNVGTAEQPSPPKPRPPRAVA